MFLLGTDPELVLFDNSPEATIKVVNALDYLNRNSNFGVDGHRYIAELRPEPAISPKELTDNIRRTLAFGNPVIRQFTWLSGAFKFQKPLGGHIHFGGITFNHAIATALDRYLPILLSHTEPREEAILRRTTNFYGGKPYGLLGDFRDKSWGFEYRTPSSFIVTPAITRGILTAAKAIVLEELESGSQSYFKIPSTLVKQLHFDKEDFYKLNLSKFKEKIPILAKILFNMKYFSYNEGKAHKKYLYYLFDHPITKGYDANQDIKISWKLFDKFFKEESKKTDNLIKSKFILTSITNTEQPQEALNNLVLNWDDLIDRTVFGEPL